MLDELYHVKTNWSEMVVDMQVLNRVQSEHLLFIALAKVNPRFQ